MSLPTQIQLLQTAAITARSELTNANLKYMTVPFNGMDVDAICLSLPPQAELYLIPTAMFPEAPPIAVMNWGDGSDATLLPLEWDRSLPLPARLASSLRYHISPPSPFRPVWTSSGGFSCTEVEELGRRLNWRRVLSGAQSLDTDTDEALQARIERPVAKTLRDSTIAIIGLGSVGSYLAEHFARSGVGELICVDHDKVEASNLSRTSYRIEHIGLSKALAIENLIRQINPHSKVEAIPSRFRDIKRDRLREIFNRADLVVGATDDPQAQILINRCAFFANKAAVFIALYRGAKGGEVAITVPSITPCLECQVKPQRRSANQDGILSETDYGTGRLQGEIALGCDIHHVCTAALKIAISILASGETSSVSDFAANALGKGFCYLTLGMEPDYWFYPQVFGETRGQYAFQSVWLSAYQDQACVVCGSQEQEDPFEAITPSFDPQSLDGLQR
jgi:molybdopterin/thiamine biosynthesis adenylyltransferase